MSLTNVHAVISLVWFPCGGSRTFEERRQEEARGPLLVGRCVASPYFRVNTALFERQSVPRPCKARHSLLTQIVRQQSARCCHDTCDTTSPERRKINFLCETLT